MRDFWVGGAVLRSLRAAGALGMMKRGELEAARTTARDAGRNMLLSLVKGTGRAGGDKGKRMFLASMGR